MNCAKCWIKGVLLMEHHEGVTVMECTRCVGFWLDRNDIDDIVDVDFTEEQLTKLLTVEREFSEYTCLHCGSLLKKVRYAAEPELSVGVCPRGHGWYWDNPKKEKREIWMKRRERALTKLMKKKTWKEFLRGVKSGELIDKLTDGLRGKKSPAIEKAVKELEKKMKEMEARRLGKVKEAKKKKSVGKKEAKKKVTRKKRGRPKGSKNKKK